MKGSKDLTFRASLVIAITGLGVGLFSLSSNITGNVIGTNTVPMGIGATFLIVGLVAGFFWLKSRKK